MAMERESTVNNAVVASGLCVADLQSLVTRRLSVVPVDVRARLTEPVAPKFSVTRPRHPATQNRTSFATATLPDTKIGRHSPWPPSRSSAPRVSPGPRFHCALLRPRRGENALSAPVADNRPALPLGDRSTSEPRLACESPNQLATEFYDPTRHSGTLLINSGTRRITPRHHLATLRFNTLTLLSIKSFLDRSAQSLNHASLAGISVRKKSNRRKRLP